MKKILVLAVLAVAVLAAMPASASCFPDKIFGTIGSDGFVTYTFMPTDFDPATVVGRFWQPGTRSLNNEGTYATSAWFRQYGAPNEFYMNGFWGTDGPVGCANISMITVVQAQTTSGGSAFFAAEVAENPGAATTFDYTTVAGRAPLTPIVIPPPGVTVMNKTGTVLTLNVTAPSLTGAYFGDTSFTDPAGVLTGLRLMKFAGPGTARPALAAGNWTFANSTIPAAGGAVTGFTFDCATLPAGQDLFLAWQINFDNGQFVGDYVGASTQVRCNSTLANPKGKPIGKGHEKH